MKRERIFKTMLVLMVAMFSTSRLFAKEAYVVLSEDGSTATFYYDDSTNPHSPLGYRVWRYNPLALTTVVFDESFADYKELTSTESWFNGCNNLKTVIGIENLKTDNVTDMGAMFCRCYSLTSLDLSSFNTSNVKLMHEMFLECSNLTKLDVSNFNTSKVVGMDSMFNGCSSLTSLDLSSFYISGTTEMQDMFRVNRILGEPAANFNEAAADVNGDGKIDVEDVVATVNIILGE